jgi:hypothetical protein
MLCALLALCASDVHVSSVAELTAAVAAAQPGTRILIAPGEYAGGLHFSNVHGEEDKLIEIIAADPANPPRFTGGGSAIQLSDISYVELRDLTVSHARDNGFNIDDGGTYDTPSHHVNLINLRVSDLPEGNHDGIKLSGLDNFYVQNCTVERWGGSAIDMVGCHRGVIQNSIFREGGSSGVQMKGGTSEVTVHGCRFEGYGERAVNIGGSTGMPYFRPPIDQMPPDGKYEAGHITVEKCTFVGGTTPVAFVGSVDCVVRFNTIYHPERWAIRILQETTEKGFLACAGSEFTDNLVVFRSDQWFSGGLNIGANTAPATFRFARNFWFCSDQPARSKPALPTEEKDGIYGQDPLLSDPEKGDFSLKPGSPAAKFGTEGFPK